MTQAELNIRIRLNFEILYPGKTADIFFVDDSEIRVIVDNLLFVAELASDDDGFLYFAPVAGNLRAPDLSVRVNYAN